MNNKTRPLTTTVTKRNNIINQENLNIGLNMRNSNLKKTPKNTLMPVLQEKNINRNKNNAR